MSKTASCTNLSISVIFPSKCHHQSYQSDIVTFLRFCHEKCSINGDASTSLCRQYNETALECRERLFRPWRSRRLTDLKELLQVSTRTNLHASWEWIVWTARLPLDLFHNHAFGTDQTISVSMLTNSTNHWQRCAFEGYRVSHYPCYHIHWGPRKTTIPLLLIPVLPESHSPVSTIIKNF